MEYKKERNIICAYDENGKFCGGWDILTGGYIGVKHTPVKTKPRNLFPNNPFDNSYYAKIYRFYHETYSNWLEYDCGARLEELISLQLMPESYHDMKCKARLTKDLVSFLRDKCNNVFSEENVRNYKMIKTLGNAAETLSEKAIETIRWLANRKQEIPFNNDLIKLMTYLDHEKVTMDIEAYQLCDMIVNYYNWQKQMYDGKVEIKRNFLTTYTILKCLYKQYREANYNNLLAKNNNLSWLYFENEIFIARPLLTREEFHIEASYQNNCVERMYMEEVANGTTHVVVIRRKDNLNTPYITCEVSLGGNIRQYLTRFNRGVYEDDAIEFKRLYKNHITSSLNSDKIDVA